MTNTFALPRHRSVELMSATISTNSHCNLACKHCYIEPHLLRVKEHIDEATYRRCVEASIEAFEIEQRLSGLQIDVLGGESTLMPFEFWSRNLPWTLDRMSEVSAGGREADFTFCTNLMWRDPRYLDLFREYRSHPRMELAVGFEGPESGRFGRNMAILPKFLSRLEAIGQCNMLTLILVMGRGVISAGPQYIIDTFAPRGVTDISCDMIFPWGSGAAYFDRYQPQYEEVARFIAELTDLGRARGIMVDHDEDIRRGLRTLTHAQNTLNEAYEIHWDQRGMLALNPNKTGAEAVLPVNQVHASDPQAPLKLIWSNCAELERKFGSEHPFCRDCDYLQTCNSGWYPHKDLPAATLARLMESDRDTFACPGLHSLWDQYREHHLDPQGITQQGDARRLQRLQLRARAEKGQAVWLEESSGISFDAFLGMVTAATHVRVIDGDLFGFSPQERIWFYDRLNKQVAFEGGVSGFSQAARIIAHAVAGNYRCIEATAEEVAQFAACCPANPLTAFLLDAFALARGWRGAAVSAAKGASRFQGSGLTVSFQYEDLIVWMLLNHSAFGTAYPGQLAEQCPTLTPASADYMQRMAKSAHRLKLLSSRKSQ